MLTLAEQINRRIGRMEALGVDLNQVKEGYQPTELEMIRAQELQAALAKFLPAPEAVAEEVVSGKGKKPKE